jgi:hypothetical protein
MRDCLIVVPFEPANSVIFDPDMRASYLAHVAAPLEAATIELEHHLGISLDYWTEGARPTFAGQRMVFPRTRSLTSVVLASALEARGLSWRVIDPGVRELSWWRAELQRLRADPPRCIGVSTTYVLNAPWLRILFKLIRDAFPEAKLIAGGAFYASSAKAFLALDADIFCAGDGESRLPETVEAVRDGRPLGDIPGLHFVDDHGALKHTGHAEMVALGDHPPVDWSLAARIEPPLDLDHDLVEAGVESQRGCVFKCEFCSYRTLSPPNMLSPEAAADAIRRTDGLGRATINLLDATATFPHARWRAVLNALIERGGAPHPMWCYARVSDLSEESAALMAQAGVRHVFVGQESGDQRMLDLMKKGTRVSQVRGAVEALARHGIIATFAFMHGFPGETAESIAATRRMIEGLNQGHEARPPVLTYLLNPFSVPDLASIAGWEAFRDAPHFLNYGAVGMSAERIFASVLETIIAVSRIPHAPAHAHLFFKTVMPTTGSSVFASHDHAELFRWLKALERGIAIFLERALEGTPVNAAELRAVRAAILAFYPQRPARPPLLRRLLGKPVLDRLQREWREEPTRGAGLVTRTYVAATVARQTADLGLGLEAWRTGQVGAHGQPRRSETGSHAAELVNHARATPAKLPKKVVASWPAPSRP